MKRDIELIRKMVLFIEDHPSGRAPGRISIPGYTPEEIGYHSYLLVDSGLAHGTSIETGDSPGPIYRILRLTSLGHDFAASARTQYIWDEVVEDMRQKGMVAATIDILKKALDARIRKHLNAD